MSTCCKEKTVGGVKYRKTGDEDTSKFGCVENCAYEKVDSPGPKFCFKNGNLKVKCAPDEGQYDRVVIFSFTKMNGLKNK